MKHVEIQFSTVTSAFQEDLFEEVFRILLQARAKIEKQASRPDCLCTHPEEADILRDTNGNTVGYVKLT